MTIYQMFKENPAKLHDDIDLDFSTLLDPDDNM